MIDRAQLITMQVQDGLDLGFPKPPHHFGTHPLEHHINGAHHPHHHPLSMVPGGLTRIDESHHEYDDGNAVQNGDDEEEDDCDETEEDSDGDTDEEEPSQKNGQSQQWQSTFNSGRPEYESTAPSYEQFEQSHFGANRFGGQKMNTESTTFNGYGQQQQNGQQSNGQTETDEIEKMSHIDLNGNINVDGSPGRPGSGYYSQFPTPESGNGSENGVVSIPVATSSNESLSLVPLGDTTTTMATNSSTGVTPSGGLVESETFFAERRRTYSFLSPNHSNNSNSSSSSSSSTSSGPTSFGTSLRPYNSTGSNGESGNAAANAAHRNYVMMQSSIINSNHYHHHYHHYHYYCPNMPQPYHPLLPPPHSLHPHAYNGPNGQTHPHPSSSTSPTPSSGSSSSMGQTTLAIAPPPQCGPIGSVPQLGPPLPPPPLMPALQAPTTYPALPWHTNINQQNGQQNGYHPSNGYHLNGNHHHPNHHGFEDDQSMTSVSNLSYPESPKCK